MVIIKWTNKFSNETGYVASLSTKNKCFINTFEESEAKRYSEKSVASLMTSLNPSTRQMTMISKSSQCRNNKNRSSML